MAARKKKTIKEEMEAMLKKVDNQQQFCQGLIDAAARGNAQAARLVLEIIQQDPKDMPLDEESNPFEE